MAAEIPRRATGEPDPRSYEVSIVRLRRKSQLGLALGTAALLASLGVSSVFAGEITGNGKATPAGDRAQSICAFSGQEDLQFFEDDENTVPRAEPTRGDPGYAQSWGQISKEDRDFLTEIGEHPGDSCNGHTGHLAGGD
jgi:hypothetical protein